MTTPVPWSMKKLPPMRAPGWMSMPVEPWAISEMTRAMSGAPSWGGGGAGPRRGAALRGCGPPGRPGKPPARRSRAAPGWPAAARRRPASARPPAPLGVAPRARRRPAARGAPAPGAPAASRRGCAPRSTRPRRRSGRAARNAPRTAPRRPAITPASASREIRSARLGPPRPPQRPHDPGQVPADHRGLGGGRGRGGLVVAGPAVQIGHGTSGAVKRRCLSSL